VRANDSGVDAFGREDRRSVGETKRKAERIEDRPRLQTLFEHKLSTKRSLAAAIEAK
jgi:hypothetical protein